MSEKPSLDSIFCSAIEIESPEERDSYVERACGDEADLKRQVERLLDAHFRGGSILDSPPRVQSVTIDRPITEKPGDTIGPYKLLQQIGEGGFGVVYMAEQMRPVRRKVALKIIKPGMDTKEIVARFDAERQAVALMDHPNIAKVFDADATESGRPYFVMELVKGVSLTDYCDKNHLSIRERLTLFVDVCHALQHAHQKGVIHRDLKSSNIMVTLHDGRPVPKVIDFGVSKALSKQLTEKTLFTAYGQMVGTPAYMSPEQAEMSGLDIDTRSDIYSLGVLLYELLTGSTPLDAKRLREAGYAEMQRIIREEEPPKPSTRLTTMGEEATVVCGNRGTDPKKLGQFLRGDLDWIVMKALDKERNRRFETSDAFAADIERFLNDQPVEACPPSNLYRFRKFARRNTVAIITASIVTAALALGLVGTSWQATRARNAEKVAQHRYQREQDAHRQTEAAELQAKWEARRATDAESQARRQLYSAQINLAFNAWNESNVGRVSVLLNQHLPTPGHEDLRGFEWYYLWKLSHGSRKTMRVAKALVASLAFSADGASLASARNDNSISLWNMASQTRTITLTGHGDEIYAMAYSPDKDLLASGSADNSVRIWDIRSGENRHMLNGHRDFVFSVVFSPDGKTIASASHDGTVKLWNAETEQLMQTLPGHKAIVGDVVFSLDGKTLATSHYNKVNLWNVESGRIRSTLDGHAAVVRCLAFSPDGKTLAAGGNEGAAEGNGLYLWDVESAKVRVVLSGHSDAVVSLSFSPDGETLASGSLDRTVRMWRVDSGKHWATLRGHSDGVPALQFTPDGEYLVSGSWDGTVRTWRVAAIGQTSQLETTAQGVDALAYSPDGTLLATPSGNDVKLWDATTGTSKRICSGHTAGVKSIAFSPDGRLLASGSRDNTVMLWSSTTGELQKTLKGHTDCVWSLAFSPDGRILASGSGDSTVKLWDSVTGNNVATLNGHSKEVWDVAFSPDGTTLVSASLDRTLKVWDVEAGSLRKTLQGEASQSAAAWSPDGAKLATGSFDNKIRLWDASTLSLQDTLSGHGGIVQSLAFSPDGRTLASGSSDMTVKIWSLPTREEMLSLRGHTGPVWAVVFSPDGKTLVSASPRENVRIWKSATEEEVLATAP